MEKIDGALPTTSSVASSRESLLGPNTAIRRIQKFFLRAFSLLLLSTLPSCIGDASSTTMEDDAGTQPEIANPCFVPQADPPPTPFFINTASRRGLDHVNVYRVPYGGPGVCLFDFNQDGFSDLYFVNQNSDTREPANILYENDGVGNFSRVQNAPVGPPNPTACSSFDFNGDSAEDLLALGVDGVRLYENTGSSENFFFRDVTEAAGLFADGIRAAVTSADIDNDGDLDIAIGGFRDANFGFMNTRDLLFINQGGERFTEEGEKRFSGESFFSRGLTIVNLFVDITRDGAPDYLSLKDGGLSIPNAMYVNDRNGYFTEQARALGLDFSQNQPPYPRDSADAMGVDVGDWNNDGVLDLLISNYACRTMLHFQCQLDAANGVFCEDNARDIGIMDISHTDWGIQWDDFDFDGDSDILTVAAQSIPDVQGTCEAAFQNQTNPQLYWNVGGGYEQYVPENGDILAEHSNSYGLVTGDLDNDHDLDAVTAPVSQTPLFLENQLNMVEDHNVLEIQLECPPKNTQCIGSVVEVDVPWKCKITEAVIRGGNFAGSQSRPLFFGLGDATEAGVTVVWPDGSREAFEDLLANQIHTLQPH